MAYEKQLAELLARFRQVDRIELEGKRYQVKVMDQYVLLYKGTRKTSRETEVAARAITTDELLRRWELVDGRLHYRQVTNPGGGVGYESSRLIPAEAPTFVPGTLDEELVMVTGGSFGLLRQQIDEKQVAGKFALDRQRAGLKGRRGR